MPLSDKNIRSIMNLPEIADIDELVESVNDQIDAAVEEQVDLSALFSDMRRQFENPMSELMVGIPRFPIIRNTPKTFSISLRHLFSNAVSPREWLKTGPLLVAGTFAPAVGWLAYAGVLAALVYEPVKYSDACILHKAWKIAGFDQIITVNDLLRVADEIRDEYEIDKVGEADISTALKDLERLGAIESSYPGYRLLESIPFKPPG